MGQNHSLLKDVFGGRALHLPSLRSPVEEAQAGLLLLREEVASLRSIFLSMTSQGHLASLMLASAGTCASRGSASRQSRCALRAFHRQSFDGTKLGGGSCPPGKCL